MSHEVSTKHRKSSGSEKLQEILAICRKMTSELDPAALFDLIAHESARLLEADRASIFLLDKEKSELWSWVAMGSEKIRFDARLGIAGAVALKGEVINSRDVPNDARFYPDIDERSGYKTKTVLAVPLRNQGGDLIGAFEVLNKKRGTFSSSDEEVLQTLAANVGIAIEAAQQFHNLKQHRDRLISENTQLRREVEERFATQIILGTDEKIQKVIRLIEQIRDTSVNVLITGESGTGKELAARAIHRTSPRANGPFVTVNCAALPETLLEAELFGIEKGVATGVERRPGRFEVADGGTLFLDEIADLTLPAQAKILRALQERTIEHVGGRQSIPVDARILAATNKDLVEEIKKERFREDLYYRLKVIHIEMPAVRTMRDDIGLLLAHFLSLYSKEMGKEKKEFSARAMERLVSYDWPGNVRELENEVKRLVASIRRKVIQEDDLSESIRRSDDRVRRTDGSLKEIVAEAVERLEKDLISEALKACNQNQLRAAKKLGLSRQGLIKKMKRYGLKD